MFTSASDKFVPTAIVLVGFILITGVVYTLKSSERVQLNRAMAQSWAREVSEQPSLKKPILLTMNVAGQTYVKEPGSTPTSRR